MLLFQKEDYGNYKCVAKNPRGETDGTIGLYSKCRLFAYALNHPAETFVELMTDRQPLRVHQWLANELPRPTFGGENV